MLPDHGCVKKQLAWNRIAFKIPEAWEIESLDYTHLIVSEDGNPKIEIKWTEQIRSKDLKQILKYKNGQIWSKQRQPGVIENTPISNLILNLDVFEHAYIFDYGTDRSGYIDAYMKNLDWVAVEKRLK